MLPVQIFTNKIKQRGAYVGLQKAHGVSVGIKFGLKPYPALFVWQKHFI
jgi:hypothetical protein